jgi:hypothetical protein
MKNTAGAVRHDPAAHRPAARPASAGDVKRQDSAEGDVKGRALRRRMTRGIRAAPPRPPGRGRWLSQPESPARRRELQAKKIAGVRNPTDRAVIPDRRCLGEPHPGNVGLEVGV